MVNRSLLNRVPLFRSQIFTANTDGETPVTQMFPYLIETRFIRILLVSSNSDSAAAMRIEILGCEGKSEMLVKRYYDPKCLGHFF